MATNNFRLDWVGWIIIMVRSGFTAPPPPLLVTRAIIPFRILTGQTIIVVVGCGSEWGCAD